MKKIILVIILVAAVALSGCNTVAKTFGGTVSLKLPKGEKLINITWKEDSLWYLTRPMTETDVAETYRFIEDTNFGIVEGEVIIIETK